MTHKPKKPNIPDFKNRQAMAEFWDNHDITDYLDELTPVEVKVSQNLTTGVTVRFNPKDLRALRKVARQKGVGVTTYLRMVALDDLRRHQAA